MMERLQLAKKITDWFFDVDPYNGCDYDDAWREMVHDLAHDRKAIADGMADALDELEDSDLVAQGIALFAQL